MARETEASSVGKKGGKGKKGIESNHVILSSAFCFLMFDVRPSIRLNNATDGRCTS